MEVFYFLGAVLKVSAISNALNNTGNEGETTWKK
jgi:hypothetical protein